MQPHHTLSEPTIVVILGLPGSGKGTQARLLSDTLGIPRIGFSDLLRREAGKETSVGREIADRLARHLTAPLDIAVSLLKHRLLNIDTKKGFVLEGFPRDYDQAAALERLLNEQNRRVDAVFFLAISTTEAVRRLSSRAVCSAGECARIFSIDRSSEVMTCTECGARLIRRDEDRPEVAIKRCESALTSPELWAHFYGSRFSAISAEQAPEQLARAILSRLSRDKRIVTHIAANKVENNDCCIR